MRTTTSRRRLALLPLVVGLVLMMMSGMAFADPAQSETTESGAVAGTDDAAASGSPSASPSGPTETDQPAAPDASGDEGAKHDDGAKHDGGGVKDDGPKHDDAKDDGGVKDDGPKHDGVKDDDAKHDDGVTHDGPKHDGVKDDDDAEHDGRNDGNAFHHGRIHVSKTANVSSVPASGGDVTFNFRITNATDIRFTIRSIHDNVFGTLAGGPGCQVGTTLAAGASCSFTHHTWLEGEAGTHHVNTVTVGLEHFGWIVRASDSARVAFTHDEQPHGDAIRITKTADRATVPETGANVVFTFSVHNLGQSELELTTLQDDVFGHLTGNAHCQVGTVLPVDGSCSFTHNTWVEGEAPGHHVNTVTVRALVLGTTDTVTDTATETVGFVAVEQNGRLAVTKDADTDSVPATGADVTFTFTIENRTDLRFTITSIEDDVFGTLAGDADCQIGTVLPANGSCSFEHAAWLEGEAGTDHVNTVVVMAEHFGWVLTASDTERVTFTEDAEVGALQITKEPNRATVPETGANVMFTFTVWNLGDAAFTITSLEDDVFGPLVGDTDCQVGTTLAAGEDCWFTHTELIQGTAPGQHQNTVTVEALVAETEQVLRDTATATVGFTAVDDVLGIGDVIGPGPGVTDTQVLAAGDGAVGTTAFTGGQLVPALVAGAVLLMLGLTLAFAGRRRTAG